MPSSLKKRLLSRCDASLLTHSRIHPLPSFESEHTQVFVKREDESGFGISGCKKRKYASLMPFLEQQQFDVVAVIGGWQSNHVAGVLQLLNEKRIPAQLFLKQRHQQALRGNALLSNLLIKGKLRELNGEEWKRVEEIAAEELADQEAFILPEGGSCREALAGAATLWLDIERNQEEKGVVFDHIFIDSGTALVAGALILTAGARGANTLIHVVQMADDAAYFEKRMQQFEAWWEEILGEKAGRAAYHLYEPFTARSFGSVNATVRAELKRIAQEEGILTDPVYTTKLFGTARQEIPALVGKVLIVHSGGGTGLMGFSS